jgi:hypothetical protein
VGGGTTPSGGAARSPFYVRLDRRRFDEELDYDNSYRGWG